MKKFLLATLVVAFSVCAVAQTSDHADPCASAIRHKNVALINTTANAKLITGQGGLKVYVCSINIVEGAATNVAIVEGTGSTCGSNTAGMFGGATAATGWNFAANGGIAMGNGLGTLSFTATAADDVCIFVSAANQSSGSISYVLAP